jgi:hypothetical protein
LWLRTPNNVLKNSIDPTYAASTQTIAGSEPQASPVGLPIDITADSPEEGYSRSGFAVKYSFMDFGCR